MARIQRLAGKFLLGELDDFQIYYDDTRNALILVDTQGQHIVELGDNTIDVLAAIRGHQFQQMRTVDLFSTAELPQGTVVDADAAVDDAVTACAIASLAVIGISVQNPHPAGSVGPICTMPGSVVDISLTAAGVRGQYVVASAAGGTGTCQAALPALGATIGVCLENTGGAGLARCIFLRM